MAAMLVPPESKSNREGAKSLRLFFAYSPYGTQIFFT